MKKGDVIFWRYKGYPSDGYDGGTASKLLQRIPGSKARVYKTLQYFTQLGFGPGYYNSSWIYLVHIRSTLQRDLTAEEVAAIENQFKTRMFEIKRYASEEEFKQERAKDAKNARWMNKRHPY